MTVAQQQLLHNVPILPVRNVRASQEFYNWVLGFEICWRWEDYFGSVKRDNIELYFQKTDQSVNPVSVYWYVEDADAVLKEFEAEGGEIAEEIRSTPWGMREFTFRDPNGHLIRVGHPEKEFASIEQFRFG